MRCPSCGHEVADSPFCERCGKPLKIEKTDPIEPKADTALGPEPSSPALSVEQSGAAPDANVAYAPDNASSRPRWYGIVWASLAIALYVAIADAAVETFLHESPLRWWIAGATALYFILCAATWRLRPDIWRRMDWATQSAASLVVLMAALGATAWMPEGLEQGLSLFGQTTSTVFAVVSAVVVALSGVLLARLSFISLPGKIAVGLLAAYGVAAFLLAAYAGTPYASLFHGGSQWTRLPFWLQGATVGGLVLVPLALLLQIGPGLRQITRAKSAEFAFKAIALCMGFMIAFAAVRMPADDVSAATASATDIPTATATPIATSSPTPTATPAGLTEGRENPSPDEAGYKQASEKLTRLYAGLDVFNSKIDRTLFEVDALADRLGSDPVAMFHFVRDEIRYEPYPGLLRGELGALLSRAGNSLDRSLLLIALLQKAGLKTQIASGQLTVQQAQLLISRSFEPVKPVPSAVPSLAELAPELSRAIGVDKIKLLNAADAMQESREKLQKEVVDYAEGETSLLSNLVSKAGVDAGAITPNDRLLEEASNHYWVQYQNSDGQWVDLDSAFADAEPGKTVASARNTFSPDSIPEELYHHLRITLTLRTAQVVDGNDGSTDDIILLDQELRVAEQQGKNIVLSNSPVPMPSGGGKLGDALAAIKGYQTALQVGSRIIPGEYFDLDGKISDTLGGPVGDVVTNAGGIGKSVGGLTGGINSVFGGGDASAGNATRIVGEWADYKITSPGTGGTMDSHDYRRDIIAPTQITSWSASSPKQGLTNLDKVRLRRRLLWIAELLPVTGAIAAEYPGYLAIKSFLDNRDSIDRAARVHFGESQAGSLARPTDRLPLTNSSLVAGVTQLTNSLGSTRYANLRSYFGRPGLVAYEYATSDTSTVKTGYDIVAFAPRVIRNPANNNIDHAREIAASLHITQGVLATRLEWALMAKAGSGLGASVLNATEVFAAANEQGTPTIVLRPGTASLQQLAGLTVPDPIKAELSESLAAGHTLVLPAKAPKFGGMSMMAWWQLDDSSGEVIGMMPGQRGQAETEYIDVLVSIGAESLCLFTYGTEHHHTGPVTNGDVNAFENLLICTAGTTFFLTGGVIGLGISKIYDLWFAIFMVIVG